MLDTDLIGEYVSASLWLQMWARVVAGGRNLNPEERRQIKDLFTQRSGRAFKIKQESQTGSNSILSQILRETPLFADEINAEAAVFKAMQDKKRSLGVGVRFEDVSESSTSADKVFSGDGVASQGLKALAESQAYRAFLNRTPEGKIFLKNLESLAPNEGMREQIIGNANKEALTHKLKF